MLSTEGSMARSIIYNDVVLGETPPSQFFVFGSFALRANSIGHLEQIDSYAPGRQISFGNLNYVADIRGDLIFEGFAAPTAALALDPERTTRSEDGNLEPAGLPAIMELATGDPEGTATLANPKTNQAPLVAKAPDSPSDFKSELSRSASSELGQGTSVPPNPMDPRFPVQTSLLNEALDLM